MKKTFILFSVSAILGAAVFSTTSCKKSSNTPLTLYDSLGGTKMVADPSTSGAKIESGRLAIRSVIDSTIFVIAGDTAINGHFTTLLAEVGAGNLTGFEALSKNLTDFVAVATGDLVAGANKNSVPAYLTNRLGAIVETLRTTVVQQ